MGVTPNQPVASAKNGTGDFETFKAFTRQILSVPHSEVKAILDAEKAAKKPSPKSASRASGDSTNPT
jgi:hypothetical protein